MGQLMTESAGLGKKETGRVLHMKAATTQAPSNLSRGWSVPHALVTSRRAC